MLPLFSPLVFSRTKDVDFRFLAIPEDFSNADMEWAQKYILSTLLSSYELEQNPIWSLFSNSKYHIRGLSCRANQLSERNTKDKFDRELYLFVGYVAKNVVYLPMQPSVFQPLYQFVHDKWEDDTKEAKNFLKKEYEIPIDAHFQKSNEQFKVNSDSNKVWVHSTQKNEALWDFFSQLSHPSSLCLNILSQKNAKEGIFLNASIIDYRDENPLEILREPASSQKESDNIQKNKGQSEKLEKPQSKEDSNESLVDAVWNTPKKIISKLSNLIAPEPPKKDTQTQNREKRTEKHECKHQGVKEAGLEQPKKETQVEADIKKEQVIDKDEPPFGGRYLEKDEPKSPHQGGKDADLEQPKKEIQELPFGGKYID